MATQIVPEVSGDAFFAGARSVERLLEGYRPRDEASYPKMRDLLAKGRVRQACDLHDDMLREAMVVSDLPILLVGTINLQVDNAYGNVSQNWRQCFRARSFPNFQVQTIANLIDLVVDNDTGGHVTRNGIIPIVPEGSGYNEARIASEYNTAKLATRGVTFTLTRQALINDTQGALQDIPAKLGDAMARTLNWAVASYLETNAALADTVALFHATHGNLETGNTALSLETIIAEYSAFSQQTSPMGRVLNMRPKYLIVPPELQFTAIDILDQNMLMVNRQITATTTSTRVGTQNLIASQLQLVVLEELTDANDWYLAADPGECSSIEVGFLDGRETPELFVSDAGNGSLDLAAADGIRHKIRHDFIPYCRHYSGIRLIPGA